MCFKVSSNLRLSNAPLFVDSSVNEHCRAGVLSVYTGKEVTNLSGVAELTILFGWLHPHIILKYGNITY